MELEIDRTEILRYLQTSKDLEDDNINSLIDEATAEIKNLINFRYLYQKFPIELTESGIKVKGTTLTLKGKSIKRHLSNSREIYIMAATLGSQVDKKISYYEKVSVTKSMIFDACATTAIEAGCDQVEAEIKKEVLAAGNEDITFRYSPGYGDLGIEIQKEILRVLKAPKKIGLTASQYNMLIPTKSVTAIIGVIAEKTETDSDIEEKSDVDRAEENLEKRDLEFEKRHCQKCLIYQDCELRRKGIYCGAKG
ncbi:MAG: Vitamin B12 dependent methionine synthase activation subunit [Halanaerobiales bacterium]|nr:Vitamin B12 dependent methionine synthase activation subunit [Halanaerobiales bacterium]